jgi:uncharacterized membrane protein YuzA (DUF378 family)
MQKLSLIDIIALILVIIGGLNWGLIGLFHFNIVSAIFGNVPILLSIIYSLVGASALWGIYLLFRLTGTGKN